MAGEFQGVVPPPGQPIVNPVDGRPTQQMAGLLSALKQFFLPNTNPQPILQTDFLSGIVALPLVKEYRIIEKLPYDITITDLAAKLSAGTATIKLQINGVDVTGSGINATTGQQHIAPSAANVAAAGTTVSLIATATAAAQDLSFVMTFTRQIGTT